jgi:sugar phosphate isomerase/epimerase
MVNRLGIERLCLFGMPPTEHVALASSLGCRFIGIGLQAMRYYDPHGYPDWSLRDDARLRRDTIAMMAHHGVTIGLCEGFSATPRGSLGDQARDLDVAAELGSQRINVVSMGRDLAPALDGFAVMAEMAAERGLQTVTEIGMGAVATLGAAQEALRHVARPDFKLLIDTMHYFRFGGTTQALAGSDPNAIGYVQLCDVPLRRSHSTYMEEALHERLVPGEGELPLAEFVRLIPGNVVVSVEVPRRSLAAAGIGARQRVAPCIEAARALLGDDP